MQSMQSPGVTVTQHQIIPSEPLRLNTEVPLPKEPRQVFKRPDVMIPEGGPNPYPNFDPTGKDIYQKSITGMVRFVPDDTNWE